MPQQNYEIRVRSRLGGTFRTAFPGLGARTQGNLTVLSGSLVDRAEPDGVLAMIETLGRLFLTVPVTSTSFSPQSAATTADLAGSHTAHSIGEPPARSPARRTR